MFKPSPDISNMLNKQYEKIDQANDQVVDIWVEDLVFSPGWWFCFFLIVIPWGLWFKYRKKNSTGRLLLGGIWVSFISAWLNYVGVTLGLWRYNVKTIPVIPDFIAWDFALMPVTIMFLLQIKPRVKPIIKAILFAGVTAFCAEPLFKWLGFFDYPHWHYFASFPFYIVIYLVANSLVQGTHFARIEV